MKTPSVDDMVNLFKKGVMEETMSAEDDIDINATFHELGLDSINSIYLLDQIEKYYNISFTPLYFWDYPTINALATQLHKENFS